MAPVLHIDDDESTYDFTKVHPKALFHLLQALEQQCPDQLDILELVEGEKPLTALVNIQIVGCYLMYINFI